MNEPVHLKIVQGKTFRKVVYAETKPLKYVPITGVPNITPLELTVVDHEVPEGWRVAVTAMKGMSQLNARSWPPRGTDWHRASVVNSDRILLNEVDGSRFDDYISDGSIAYYTPQSLLNCTARMEIRTRVGGTLLETLTSENGKIIVDSAAFTTTLLLSAVATAAYTWVRGVFDLELVKQDGTVLSLLAGDIHVTKEVTTDD